MRRPAAADPTAVDDTAYDLLLERLTIDDGPEDATADIVLAAADGADALRTHLDGGAAPERRSPHDSGDAAEPARVYLERIAVEGFRGVGPHAKLPLEPGPGLTLVVGRNGSGKSSFAEGLEVLLTGQNLRWEGKAKVWRQGWRNLHTEGPAKVAATFRLDGHAEPLTVSRTWPAGEDLDGGPGLAVSGPHEAWAELGWDVPLQRFRPLLSYNELGAMFSSRAAELYDALSAVLGLEPFEAVGKTLAEARLAREKTGKTEKAERQALLAALQASTDERAVAIAALLGAATPDVDAVHALLSGDEDADDADLVRLQQLAALPVPSADEVAAAFAARDAAQASADELAATDAARMDQVAGMLEQALHFHEDHGDAPCPVCGEGRLDTSWSLRAQAEVQDLQRHAAELRAARQELVAGRQAVERLFAPTTPALVDDLDWDARTTDASAAEAIRTTVTAARAAARDALERRNAAWRPLEQQIDTWLTTAERAAADKAHVKALKGAEAWVKELLVALRRERLAPVVEAAQRNWRELRHESNVQLGDVELKASGNQRSAVFDVTVDGTPTSAYGVMSQGELSALAISVFLPRASLPQSPFGFMVIDDPVQSMDPAKVDGLARVLAQAGKTRQVVVFTHDERLPQAVHRLGIDARVVKVRRRAQSKVEVVLDAPPSERHLLEAFAMAKSDDLTEEVRRRVVPVFCRSAIEAACATRIRRRELAKGTPHAEVEARLSGLTATRTWLADAFGLSVAQSQELNAKLAAIGGTSVVALATKGAHADQQVDPLQQARATETLVKTLEAA